MFSKVNVSSPIRDEEIWNQGHKHRHLDKSMENKTGYNPSPPSKEDPSEVSGGKKDIAIHIKNLSKCYQIYDAPHDRLKQFIFVRR